MQKPLIIRDILKRPYFKNVIVHGSEKALNRTVEWAHVLEVDDVGHLLNGNELILTTGLTWENSEEKGLNFLKQIIERGAAGLAVDMGRVIDQLPESMIRLANLHDFPLILIENDVRYIDVTHDIHTCLINRQQKMMEDLDKLSARFNTCLLRGEGIRSLLTLFFEVIGKPIGYIPEEGEPLFVPPGAGLRPRETKNAQSAGACPVYSGHPIVVLGKKFGKLMILSEEELDHFSSIALDRCATAVAQDLMRTTYWEERRYYRDNQWIAQWLRGELEEKEIGERLSALVPDTCFGRQTVVVFESVRKNVSVDMDRIIRKSVQARSLFSKKGFFTIPSYVNQHIVYILFDLFNRTNSGLRPAIESVLPALIKSNHSKEEVPRYLCGIGRFVQAKELLKISFSDAMEVIAVQKKVGLFVHPFYDELHVYHVLYTLDKAGGLESFVEHYLGELIRYDSQKERELLHTLKVYMDLNGVKKETAESLYVSRQALYNRLDKIRQLLGEDFMSPKKRIAIEIAVQGYEYLATARSI